MDVSYKLKQSTTPSTKMLQHISIKHQSLKIMISRLQTNGTNMSQRLQCTIKTTTSPSYTKLLIAVNRPDIVVINLVNSTRKQIDMTGPSDRNITLKEMEKKSKYKDLKLQMQRMWHMKIIVIPAVLVRLIQ